MRVFERRVRVYLIPMARRIHRGPPSRACDLVGRLLPNGIRALRDRPDQVGCLVWLRDAEVVEGRGHVQQRTQRGGGRVRAGAISARRTNGRLEALSGGEGGGRARLVRTRRRLTQRG